MSIKIGHASIDENGNIAGGKTGDQTKKEICTREWYSKPWNVYLECTDRTTADKAASIMEQICADNNFGYDQDERTSGYFSIIKNGYKVKGAKGEFDCSSLVATCYNLAGLSVNFTNTTRTLRKALLATGKFVEYTGKTHLLTGDLSKRGGVYLSEGHHVVMVLEADNKSNTNPYVMPSTVVEFGETGTSVRWVQWELVRLGYNIKIDGEFGSKTDKAVKDFQKTVGLKVDGQVGPETRKMLIK